MKYLAQKLRAATTEILITDWKMVKEIELERFEDKVTKNIDDTLEGILKQKAKEGVKIKILLFGHSWSRFVVDNFSKNLIHYFKECRLQNDWCKNIEVQEHGPPLDALPSALEVGDAVVSTFNGIVRGFFNGKKNDAGDDERLGSSPTNDEGERVNKKQQTGGITFSNPEVNAPKNVESLFFSHHEKIVVIDRAVGFVGGIDIAENRWDNDQYKLFDKQEKLFRGQDYRNPFKPIENPEAENDKDLAAKIGADFHYDFLDRATTKRMPWQDIAGVVYGFEIVTDLAKHFIYRWNFVRTKLGNTKVGSVMTQSYKYGIGYNLEQLAGDVTPMEADFKHPELVYRVVLLKFYFR